MARNTAVDLSPSNPDLDPNRSDEWTIPPVLSLDPPLVQDQGFVLTQGIVYHVINSGTSMFQNVSDNEDDYIEFSFHGDRDGEWMRLNTHSIVECTGDIFFLNRTHKQNAKIAVISTSKNILHPHSTKSSSRTKTP